MGCGALGWGQGGGRDGIAGCLPSVAALQMYMKTTDISYAGHPSGSPASQKVLGCCLWHGVLMVGNMGNITGLWPETCLQGYVILCDSIEEEEMRGTCGSPPFNWGGGVVEGIIVSKHFNRYDYSHKFLEGGDQKINVEEEVTVLARKDQGFLFQGWVF